MPDDMPPKTGGVEEAAAGGAPAAPASARPLPSPRKPVGKLLEGQRLLQESLERQHWQASGKQVSSVRDTQPSYTWGPAVRLKGQRVDVRCREICNHPSIPNPGPTCTVRPEACPSSVVKGFGRDRRFMDDSPASGGGGVLAQQGRAIVKDSTNCSPLSRTYPYEEAPRAPQVPAGEGEAVTENAAAADRAPAHDLRASPLHDKSLRRRGHQRADLNDHYFRHKVTPNYSFGSSGLGSRFKMDTKFARNAQIATTSRLTGFRELREQIPVKIPADGDDAGKAGA